MVKEWLVLVLGPKPPTAYDCQLLEDVICLVFLEYYLAGFAQEHDEPKLINILRRTWRKMSARGQQAALELKLPEHLRRVVEKAIAA